MNVSNISEEKTSLRLEPKLVGSMKIKSNFHDHMHMSRSNMSQIVSDLKFFYVTRPTTVERILDYQNALGHA